MWSARRLLLIGASTAVAIAALLGVTFTVNGEIDWAQPITPITLTQAPETTASEAPPTLAITTEVPLTATSTTTTPPLPEGIQLDDCAAGYEADYVANGNLYPCLQGPSVERLQRALVAWDLGEPVEVDGYFGPGTQRALLAWQVRHGWPDPTSDLIKWEPLVGQVLASLDHPALPRTGPCPKPTLVTVEDALADQPHAYRPIFGLCDAGEPISNMQLVLARFGYQVEQTGIFDTQTAQAVNRYSLDVLGYSNGVTVGWDLWWAIVGD
jgi:peptidoglycan hydrolase-like protein with peptidoglycan-binding domain